MFMRVSVGMKRDIESAIKTYNLMSQGWFTHATPTFLIQEHLNLKCPLVFF